MLNWRDRQGKNDSGEEIKYLNRKAPLRDSKPVNAILTKLETNDNHDDEVSNATGSASKRDSTNVKEKYCSALNSVTIMTAAEFIEPESSSDSEGYIAPEKDVPAAVLSPSQTARPWHQVALPSLSFAGVALAWAVLIGHATAHLRKLGLSDGAVGLAWLAGPITGTLVQPIVGSLSDECTSRLGRRRPFMIIGSAMTFVGLVLFSQAGEIARLLGDPVHAKGGGSRTGLVIGLASFWVVDFAVNFLQTPTRALLADVVPAGQLPLGSALFAVANGFGKGVGYALGAFSASIREAFFAAGVVIVALTLVTSVFVREERLESSGQDGRGFVEVAKQSVAKTVHAVRNMPDGVGEIFVVQWLTYLGLMYLLIYASDWVGRDIFHGDADAPPGSALHTRFEAGVRYGNMCLLGMALVSMALAPLTPCLIRLLGVRAVWGSCLATTGACFLYTPWAGRGGAAMALCSAGAAISAAFTIPWAAVSGAAGRAERGVLLATFNLSQATPGVVASATGGLLVRAGGGSLRVLMGAVGACALGAAVAVAFVDGQVVRASAGGKAPRGVAWGAGGVTARSAEWVDGDVVDVGVA